MSQVNKMNQVQDDEIDLFELFQTLWDGKWLISASVAIAVLLGSSLIFVKEKDTVVPLYKSKLVYSIDTLPVGYNSNDVLTDFYKKFYSINVFENWKKREGNVSIAFEDFSATEVVDGFVLSKDEDKQLAILATGAKGSSFVRVKSNQLPVLEDFFKYANYINELLKNDYVGRLNDELKIIDARFKDLGTANSDIVNTVHLIDRYIVAVDRGANILDIRRPTMPETIQPKKSNPSLILTMSVILGGMVGVMYVLISNAYRKRKESSAKA